MQTKFRYDIQGLRALAVLSVVITHTFPKWLTGGYIGVDIFFVISGYLISKILFKECSQNSFSISNFYERRIKRIFPALIFVVISTIIAAYFILSPMSFREVGRNVFSTMLFVSNVDYWKSTNYFANAAELKPLLHTWSLSVEEQFYIFFPILIFYLYKIPNKKIAEVVLWALFLISLIVSEIAIQIDSSAAYYFFPTRAFELILGAIVAYRELFKAKKTVFKPITIYTGYLLTILPIALFSASTRFPGLSALIPTMGTALLITIGSSNPNYKEGFLLTNKWMVYVGNISFSLYLWHWPVLAFMRNLYTVELSLFQSFLAVFISFIMAAISYKAIEQPFMKNKKMNFLNFGLISIILLSAVSLTIYLTNGFPTRFSTQSLAIFKSSNDFNPLRNQCHYEGKSPPRSYESNCVIGTKGIDPQIAVWGDSHGAEFAYMLGEAAKSKHKSIMEITASSCPPSIGYQAKARRYCESHNQSTLYGLIHDPRISTVVMVANYVTYSNYTLLEAGIKGAIDQLLDANKKIVLVSQTPLMKFDPPSTLGLMNEKGQVLNLIGLDRREFEHQTEAIKSLIQTYATEKNIIVFEPKNQLCNDVMCKVYDQKNGVLYFNDNHLSLAGAEFAFRPLIKQLTD